jgi:hypothetical protein
MPDPNHTSGEINTLILARVTEVAAKVETVANGQADLKLSMQLSFNDGKHRMDGLAQRIETLEKSGCQRLAQHQTTQAQAQKSDDDSDWSKPAKHKHERSQRDVPTEQIGRKLDLAMWIKYGAMIGAAVAGAYAAVKAGAS